MRWIFVVMVLVWLAGMAPCEALAQAQTAPVPGSVTPLQGEAVKPKTKHHRHHSRTAGMGASAETHARSSSVGPAPFSTFRDCVDCTEMVMLPAGSFTMGSPESENGRFIDENPQHVVSLSAFAIGKEDVTRGEFAAFVKATGWDQKGCYILNGTWYLDSGANWRSPGYSQSDRDPVVCVSWDDAQAYVRWLSVKSGKSYRLPSEAEWEYAARAGTTTSRYWGDSSSDQCAYANGADRTYSQTFRQDVEVNGHCADGYVFSNPSGVLRTNPWGLDDMLGNVFQWTSDCWNEGYNGAPLDGSAWVTGDCVRRVLRGGSWYNDPRALRSAYRFKYKSGDRVSKVGFRVVREGGE